MEPLKHILVSLQSDIPIIGFTINFILTALLSFILGIIYNKYSLSLSNKSLFANNFILLSTTTMLMISVIKSSLALSLGLVGALSVIRFRTAIKDPEELTYLFLSIAIGLGTGANQTYITISAFILTVIVIIGLFFVKGYTIPDKNMFINVECESRDFLDINTLVDIINKNCTYTKLRRYDTSQEFFEAIFLVQLKDFNSLKEIEKNIVAIDKNSKIIFLDQDTSLL